MAIDQRHPFWGVSVAVHHLTLSLVLEIPYGFNFTVTVMWLKLAFWLTSQHLTQMVSLWSTSPHLFIQAPHTHHRFILSLKPIQTPKIVVGTCTYDSTSVTRVDTLERDLLCNN